MHQKQPVPKVAVSSPALEIFFSDVELLVNEFVNDILFGFSRWAQDGEKNAKPENMSTIDKSGVNSRIVRLFMLAI